MTIVAFRSGMNVRSTIAMLTIAAGLATMLGLAGCSPRPADVVEPGSYAAANSSDCLPAITLVDQHGHDVTLASLKGRPVLDRFHLHHLPGTVSADDLADGRGGKTTGARSWAAR